MNLILFEPGEWESPLPRDDSRIQHILTILKFGPGQEFDAGVIDGPRGKAWIEPKDVKHGEGPPEEQSPDAGSKSVKLNFRPTTEQPPLAPLTLAVGACRPQTVRKILLQATALGVGSIHFFASGKTEKGYLNSKVYRPEQIRPYLIEGAQQAFCTRLPSVEVHDSFDDCFNACSGGPGVSLDNYEAVCPLGDFKFPDYRSSAGNTDERGQRPPLTLWIGSERGWSAEEREEFRRKGITLCSLGSRVLRTETAAVAGIAFCLSGMGWMG